MVSLAEKGTGVPNQSAEFPSKHSPEVSILNLPENLKTLREQERLLFDQLFEISITKENNGSRLAIPAKMKPMVLQIFGNGKSPEETIRDIENQRIVRIQDRFFKFEAVYNPLRKKRYQPTNQDKKSSFQKDIDDPEMKERCEFCSPDDNTPFDPQLGKLSRGNVKVVVNLTKFADVHMLALGKHNPYETTEDDFINQMDVLLEYANAKAEENPDFNFFRIGLNRGYKAAGSKIHDHPQGELRPGSMHFPYAERFNEVIANYENSGKGKFIDDFFKVHEILGLGSKRGKALVMSMLVPLKEHGVMIIDNGQSCGAEFSISDDFKKSLWDVQQFMIKERGVREYNIFILPAPRNPECADYWNKYRTVAIFVDRGHSDTQNSDWGYAELSCTSVISYDPFDFGPELNKYLLKRREQELIFKEIPVPEFQSSHLQQMV